MQSNKISRRFWWWLCVQSVHLDCNSIEFCWSNHLEFNIKSKLGNTIKDCHRKLEIEILGNFGPWEFIGNDARKIYEQWWQTMNWNLSCYSMQTGVIVQQNAQIIPLIPWESSPIHCSQWSIVHIEYSMVRVFSERGTSFVHESEVMERLETLVALDKLLFWA